MFYNAEDNTLHVDDAAPRGAVRVSDERYSQILGRPFESDEEGLPRPTLAARRAEAWEHIKAERDRRQNDGVRVAGKWFHSDPSSRIQQLALTIIGANLPPGVQWKTMDGSFVEMTQALAAQIFSGSVLSDMALFEHGMQLKQQIDASILPEAIDILSGWPQTFGDEHA